MGRRELAQLWRTKLVFFLKRDGAIVTSNNFPALQNGNGGTRVSLLELKCNDSDSFKKEKCC